MVNTLIWELIQINALVTWICVNTASQSLSSSTRENSSITCTTYQRPEWISFIGEAEIRIRTRIRIRIMLRIRVRIRTKLQMRIKIKIEIMR